MLDLPVRVMPNYLLTIITLLFWYKTYLLAGIFLRKLIVFQFDITFTGSNAVCFRVMLVNLLHF